ncbi:alpha,alpha-trehalose-phosphate synthase (UDP-forming) [Hydrogenophaga sp.]|uniref:alpha,alpha-trehalose-phosphate synthase (UDP-forming) n=1 Tax=Hydrogenophaga sp. TaxID=1904254 RepID=UPI0035662BD8
MKRLVVVSNRVADPRKAAAGGLAVALGDALSDSGGLWFGWSGQMIEPERGTESRLQQQRAGNVTLATIDLTQADHDAYYLGYSNGVLWPVFHNRLDLADFDHGDINSYRRVNRLFAQHLATLLRPDDVIWIHDYHLIPLAAELRALGCEQRIGFFLHTPLPSAVVMAAIPQHEWLMRSLFAYDLIGLQTQTDLGHFAHYVRNEARAEQRENDVFTAFGRTVRAQAFPIGIDVDEFIRLGEGREAQTTYANMRDQFASKRLLVGVDRLDYSKGLPQRLRAFQRLLHDYPENRGRAVLIQVAAPSRESVSAYSDLRHELEGLSGAINGEFGELDWMPVRYINRSMARKRLPGLYRASSVALVTPLCDGMNLVAKEFVAAQDPANPGVLILSRFAGAAEQMTEALLVNPHDQLVVAEATQRALNMPLAERQARHASLLEGIRRDDVHAWRKQFLQTLESKDV